VADALFRLGITGVTDATPGLDERAVALLGAATPLRMHLLGGPTPAAGMSRISVGPRKLLLRDHDLPTYDELCAMVDPDGRGHARSPVAVHCVTRESLILTLAVLTDVGSAPGDRIEHASVVPAGVEAELARLGLTVVTQPDLLRTRGDVYLHDVDADDLPHLYPWASLVRAGALVAPSSDAPFGDIDPWQVIRSARDRQTRDGTVIGPDERVTADVALRGYLTAPEDPGGPSRRVETGAVADLCLLSVALSEALAHPESSLVRLVLADGRPVATTS
jgi:predicted amidohydrolase YtcJ